MKAILLATICLFALTAIAPAFAQSSKSCTTTCSGNANSGGRGLAPRRAVRPGDEPKEDLVSLPHY